MTETIDRAALAHLLATVGGDKTFLAELIDAFFGDTSQLIAQMRQASAARDAESLRRAAHSLKSNSANLGATTLAALCQQVEEIAKAGTLDGANARIAQIEIEYETVKRALQAERAH